MANLLGLFAGQLPDWTGLTVDELSLWAERIEHMNDLWWWYDGTRLREEDEALPMDRRSGKRPLRYPLQINLVAPAARAHSFALWGEVEDTSEGLVRTVVEPPFDEIPTANVGAAVQGEPGFPALPRVPTEDTASINSADRPDPSNVTNESLELDPATAKTLKPVRTSDKEAARVIAKQAERVLANIAYENNLRSMFTDCGLAIQILAGVAFKIGWDPKNPMLPTGIRVEYIDPRHFHPRWRGNDYWNLTEAWIKLTISGESASREFGVRTSGKVATYVEYWSRNRMWIKIDGQVATVDGQLMDIQHDWGFVPILYIPHERKNAFWGTSLAQDMIGLTREVNARMADMGDAVRLSIKRILKAKNLKGSHPVKKELAGGITYYDLGRAISQGDPQPDLDVVESPQLPQTTKDFQNMLLEMGWMQMLTPSIVYGREEGSQRSGQTLYQRMWPLMAHVRTERTHWTTGLNLMSEMALKILALKKRAGIGPQHLNLRKRQLFAPMVPVDREKLVDEMIRRLQENAIGLPHALEAFGDVSDIETEQEDITARMEELAKLQMLMKPQGPHQNPPINRAESKE